jgi:HicB family
MPKSLHRRAARMAQRDGVSLNQLIVTGLAQYLGEHQAIQSQPASYQMMFDATQVYTNFSLPTFWIKKLEHISNQAEVISYQSTPTQGVIGVPWHPLPNRQPG